MIAPNGRKRNEMPRDAHAMICPSAGLSAANGPKYCVERMRPAAWA